jgi:WD40 repeat protein
MNRVKPFAAVAALCSSLAVGAVGACASGGHGSNLFPPQDSGGAPVSYDDAWSPGFDSPPPFGDVLSLGDTGAMEAGGLTAGTLSAVHIVPANAMLTVKAGAQVTQTYQVLGIVDGMSPEVDVTSRFVFYVPDNYLVGGFPANGGPTFTSRLPMAPTDPPQQGGTLTVQAQAANPGNAMVTATTSLTVQLLAQLSDPSGAAVPANAQNLFGPLPDGGGADSGSGAGPDPTRAPTVYYPNDGVMLPPNLKQLEVHFQPGSTKNTLFRVSFSSAAANIVYYARCGNGNITAPGLVQGACALHLDQTGYGYLAQSNAGQGNVVLTVAGTDDTGTGYGVSTSTSLQFAQEPVNGGVYYWTVTNPPRIMRFDFGGTQTTPDIFIAPTDYGTSGTCIGCHTLSHDGTKIAASQGGQNNGQLIYIDNIGKPTTPPYPARTDPNYLTQNGDANDHIQFASFNPAGDKFVAVYGDTGSTSAGPDGGMVLDRNKLWFHDGTTGVIIAGAEKLLAFEPDHPSWSPDGTMIAMTHVGAHNTSQREYSGGIDVAAFANGVLGDPFVVIPSLVPGTNTYNPDFVPDSSFFVFSQTTCPVGQENTEQCDSDVANNLNATTWATKPVANATPVHLDKAGTPGLADNGQVPMDTFPRSTPFKTAQGTGTLFWFTVASQRNPGLRQKTGTTQQLLWMFAVDPSRILSGQDGSFPGFFLPFQDLSTSNHIAQWTQKIVSTNPPPPPPTPPPPPPPPVPPAPK